MGIIRTIQTDLTKSALQLIVECRERLYSIAYRECGNVADAEDLVSQTIAKAIQKLDGNTEVENLFAWLRAMMLNLRKDEMRRAVVRGTQPVESEQLESYAGADWSTDEKILKDSDSEAIHQAIEELDPKYRQAMLMRYYEDFSFKEIAQILKLPMGTVSRRIQIAHHLLAAKLGSKLGRKPVAVLLAALLGIGTLFGAWQAGVSIVEAMSDDGRAVSMKPPATENNQTTLTTTKEKPPMNTIKGTLLAAATAVSLMSTAQADEPIPVTPETMESSGAGTVKKVGDDIVLSFTDTTHTYSFTIPEGVESIRYLVVGGGGAGGAGNEGNTYRVGGGGGAGGMLTGENIGVGKDDVLTIKVGAGGLPKSGDAGGIGGDSSLFKGDAQLALAYGGGGGGATEKKVATEGASGGGGSGAYQKPTGAGASAKNVEPKQGHKGGGGGSSSNATAFGSGGGGAGGEGGTGAPNNSASGVGGVGLPCDITGEEDKYYAAGGGGASHASGDTIGSAGGRGGGGAGGAGKDKNSGIVYGDGANGEDGTGSGGGGGGRGDGLSAGGKGGDGVVIIRYLAPAAAKAKVYFSYDPNTVTWVATAYGEEVVEESEVDNGATVTVVATPKDGYEYASAPEGWTKNEDDTVTAGFVAEAPKCTIPIPAATAIPFTMNFTPGANASYTATVDGQPVQNGAKIRTGKQIVVVATPNTDCEYTAIPEGWSAGEVEGTITRTIMAGEGVPQLTIPDAAAIDYVQVQFTSNGSAFFEATNAVGEKVEGRVRAGTEVFVKIWAGVGFVYTETPTGWTWEAEGDAYTKVFTAVSGSTLTIQIPNAKEIGGKWTKEIPANIGYKLEVEKDLVFVFTNTAAEGCEMILPSGVTSLRYLVVGGGGAGGGRRGGGGGAGGMLTDNDFKVVGRTLKINVGQGGGGVNGAAAGHSGGDSKLETGIASIVAYGGGGGAAKGASAVEGGSGGGGAAGDQSTPKPGAPAKDPLQGNAGGTGETFCNACGGGGAGEPGKAGSTTVSGAGGAGRTCDITGEDNKYYAAGGGGASRDYRYGGGAGGSGIGGDGGKNDDGLRDGSSITLRTGLPGVDGTGSGGGGAAGDTDDYSGKGGDGVVIIRFPKPKGGVIIFLM